MYVVVETKSFICFTMNRPFCCFVRVLELLDMDLWKLSQKHPQLLPTHPDLVKVKAATVEKLMCAPSFIREGFSLFTPLHWRLVLCSLIVCLRPVWGGGGGSLCPFDSVPYVCSVCFAGTGPVRLMASPRTVKI